jgi:hypothetical protein
MQNQNQSPLMPTVDTRGALIEVLKFKVQVLVAGVPCTYLIRISGDTQINIKDCWCKDSQEANMITKHLSSNLRLPIVRRDAEFTKEGAIKV